ncbi:hypothetical protein HK102_014103 [Quaeritorhiza haematococci]|nr:hypothetical protein HK102_014103 [Quaeritorhiza haematococci]
MAPRPDESPLIFGCRIQELNDNAPPAETLSDLELKEVFVQHFKRLEPIVIQRIPYGEDSVTFDAVIHRVNELYARDTQSNPAKNAELLTMQTELSAIRKLLETSTPNRPSRSATPTHLQKNTTSTAIASQTTQLNLAQQQHKRGTHGNLLTPISHPETQPKASSAPSAKNTPTTSNRPVHSCLYSRNSLGNNRPKRTPQHTTATPPRPTDFSH